MSIDLRRHEGLIPRHLFTTPTHICGCGGVGSHVGEQIARMGLARTGLHLYDGDVVESHNLPNQQFLTRHLGLSKVTGLAEQVSEWSGGRTPAFPHPQMVTEPIDCSGIVFLCLDNMAARKRIFEQSLWGNANVRLVIETRMDALSSVVYAVDPNNTAHRTLWESYWFPDEAAVNLAGCGGHFAIPTTVAITAMIAVQMMLAYSSGKGERRHNQVVFDASSFKTTAKRWPDNLPVLPQ